MHKTIKSQSGKGIVTFGVRLSRDSVFHFIPYIEPLFGGRSVVSYRGEGQYNVSNVMTMTSCRAFWMGLIFYVTIHEHVMSRRAVDAQGQTHDLTDSLAETETDDSFAMNPKMNHLFDFFSERFDLVLTGTQINEIIDQIKIAEQKYED